MAAAACGRIVTVPKTGSNGGLVPSGDMFVRYRVAGFLDFNTLRYLIVFNTSGNGITPLASTLNTSFLNYSFILIFGGTQVGGAQYGLASHPDCIGRLSNRGAADQPAVRHQLQRQ